MNEIDKVIKTCSQEVGYLEKSKEAYHKDKNVIYKKTEGAGNDNCTKYAVEMDNLNLYNGKKNFYSWCNVFIDWCFVQALGLDRAKELLLGWSAGCTQDYNWFKERGQIVKNPQRGDLVFFGKTTHIGIIEDVKDGRIYTIEGNTSNKAELVTNGGCVARKSYSINSKYIHSFARPNYINTPDIRTKAHIQDYGWTDWKSTGEVIGTVGEDKRIEAIVLEGDVSYRVHAQDIGWTDWKNSGEIAGTVGESKQIEAIEIKSSKCLDVQEHVQDIGWMPASRGTDIRIGTEGKGLRLEAFKVSIA